MHITYRGTVVQCQTPACTSDSITTTVNHSIEQDGVDMDLYGLAFDAVVVFVLGFDFFLKFLLPYCGFNK